MNPYQPTEAASAAPAASRSLLLLRVLATAFALYTVFGHLIFYARVAETYGRLGPAGVELYFLSSLVLLFLSFLGAAFVFATSAYSFRRLHFRPVLTILIAVTALALGGAVLAFFTLGEYWVRGVVFVLTLR